MRLEIYSLQKSLFNAEAAAVICPTEAGEITVLPNHHPLIGVLKSGVIEVKDKEEKEHFFPVASGFIEVSPEHDVRLIIDQPAD